MSNGDTHRTCMTCRYALAGIGLGVGFWVLESFIHSRFFGDGTFGGQLLHPTVNEIWMRLFIALLLVALMAFVQKSRSSDSARETLSLSHVRQYVIWALAFWTVAVGGLLYLDIGEHDHEIADIAKASARAAFDKDVLYRRWAASHGGLYVPATEKTPPNPYLSHVPDRDITSPSGVALTLVNPAYMTRQIHEWYSDEYNSHGHITSLKPLRPENTPDDWERRALEAFDRGEAEVAGISTIDGAHFMRLMQPMVAEEGCIKCHGVQGYKVGDIRGGVSVSVPMEPYRADARATLVSAIAGHGLLWLAGALAIFYGGGQLDRQLAHRRRAEEALRESEAMYLDLYDNAPDMFASVDAEAATILQCNQTLATATGYSKKELIGRSVLDIYAPDFRDDAKRAFESFKTSGQVQNAELKLRCKDGRTIDVILNASAVRDEQGNILQSRSSLRDVSELKAVERELNESEQRYRALVEGTENFVTRVDREGKFIYANQASERVFGLRPGECIGLSAFDFVHPDDREMTRNAFAGWVRHKTENVTLENRQVSRTGEVRDMLWTSRLVFDEVGEVVWIDGIARDITQRKQAEQELWRANERFKVIMDSLDALVYVADMETHEVLFLNEFGRRVWGDIVGRRCWETLQSGQSGPCEFCTNRKLIDENGQPVGIYEWELQNTANGRWYECRDQAINWVDGRLVRMEIATDISDRKKAEEALHMARFSVDRAAFEVFWITEDARFAYVNDMTCETLGYSREELLERGVFDVDPDFDMERWKGHWEDLKQRKSFTIETRHRRKDGSVFPVEVTANYLEYGDKGYDFAYAADITERKRAQAQAEVAAKRLQESIENMLDGYALHEAIFGEDGRMIDFRYLEFNPAAERIVGISRDAIIGKTALKMFPSIVERGLMDKYAGVMANREPAHIEDFYYEGDNLNKAFEISCYYVDTTHFVCVFRDVTAQVRAKRELERTMDLLSSIKEAQSLYISSGDTKQVFAELLKTLVSMTDSEYGFLDEVLEDENGQFYKKSLALSDISWDEDSQRLYQQLVGGSLEFRNLDNLAGMPGLTGGLVIANDPAGDSRSGGIPHGHPAISAFMGVPMFFGGKIVGVAGVANRPGGYDEGIAEAMEVFISTCAAIIHAVQNNRRELEYTNALLKSEQRYRTVVEDQTEFIVRWRPGGVHTFVNESYCRYFGLSCEEAMNSDFLPLIHEDDREAVRRRVESISRANPVSTGEHRVRLSDGSIGWNQWTDRAIFDDQGNLTEYQSVGRDITEQKRAQEQAAIFKRFAEESRHAHGMADLEGNIIYCNQALCRMLGEVSLASAIGNHISLYYFDEDRKKLEDEILPCVVSGQPWSGEMSIVSAEGQVTPTIHSVFAIHDSNGRPLCLANVVTDITEQKRAREALAESEERFRVIYEQSPLAYQSLDNNGCLLEANPAWLEMLGYTRDEVIGRWIGDFLTGESIMRLKERFPRFRDTGQVRGAQFSFVHKDGSLVIVEVDGRIEHDPDGSFRRTHCILRNVTERERSERMLRDIAAGISAETGEAFFHLLVEHLAKALDAEYALIGELAGEHNEKVRTVAIWAHGRLEENTDYDLAGTPCENVVDREVCFYPRDVQSHFPDDHLLQEMGVEAYVGAPLFDSTGRPLGIVVVMYTKPLDKPELAASMIQIFAARAAAELERKQAEQQLRVAKEFSEDIIETANALVIVLDKDGVIETFNKFAEELTGYEKCEVIGKDLFELFIRPDERNMIRRLYNRVLADAPEASSHENVIVTKAGSARLINWSNHSIKDNDGRSVGAIAIGVDVTDERTAMESVAQNRRQLRSLVSQLTTTEERERKEIAGVIHDNFLQKLALCRMQLSNLKQTDQEADTHTTVERINESIRGIIAEMRSLTFDLCSPILYDIGLEAAVRDWLDREIRGRYDIAFEFEDDGQHRSLREDLRLFLYRAIRELCTNVVKHSQAHNAKASVCSEGDVIRIVVADDGVGFVQDDTRSEEEDRGGLGLFGIRERLDYFHADMDIVSDAGKGTRITITAPLEGSETPAQENR